MNREERRNKNKKGNDAQPGWAQKGKSGPPQGGKTNVQKLRQRTGQERGGAKK